EGVGKATALVTSRFPLTDLEPMRGRGYPPGGRKRGASSNSSSNPRQHLRVLIHDTHEPAAPRNFPVLHARPNPRLDARPGHVHVKPLVGTVRGDLQLSVARVGRIDRSIREVPAPLDALVYACLPPLVSGYVRRFEGVGRSRTDMAGILRQARCLT